MRKSSDRFLRVFVIAFCFCVAAMLLGSPLSAQTTFGSISGTITDASGSAVAGAQVTLTSADTSAKQTFTTGADGLYSFVNLNPGEYTLEVEKSGFKHVKREAIVVQVQQAVRIDAAMELGAVSQTVEVTAETPLLQPTSTSLGQVIDQRATNEIPLNGRNVFNLITLAPAAIAQGGSGGSQVGQNPFSWGNYQVGGSFGNESVEYIDGQPVNIGYINLPVLIPDQDAISEFKVQYNNLGSEWGKFAGGVVNLSTKGGTNQYHGEAYEYLRNKVLNSRPFFDTTNPPYVQNQFGGTFGGPVIKDNTFFFFAYDGYRQRASSVFTTTVPTAAERGGVFPADVQIFDPLSVTATCLANPTVAADCARTQFASNTIPTARLSSAALLELKFIPMPTNSAEQQNFTAAAASGGNTNQYVGRVDHNINSEQHIFARYNFFNLLDLPTDPFATGLCADRCAETYQTNALAINYSYTIRPDLILNISASGSRFHYLRSPTNSNFDLTQYGWPAAYNTEIPSAGRSPFTPCFSPQDPSITCSQGQSFITDHDTQVNVSPSLTWIKGRHTWVFGGQLTETYDNYAQTNIASGAFAFDGSWTSSNAVSGGSGGISFADFLLGYGLNQSSVFNHNYGEAQIPALVAQKETYRGFYFGDTWRVTSKLTLTYGLRYDLPGNWSVRHDLSTYWDPSAVNRTVTGCQQDSTGLGVAGSPCPGDIFFVKTGINPGRTAVPIYKKELMPRLGVAYSWDQKTVIRAGYGIFFIPNWILFNLNPSNDPINTSSTLWVATTNGGITPNSTLTATNCAFTPGTPGTLNCPTNGPFGPSLNTPLTRSGNVSAFDAGGNPFDAPYRAYSPPYVQQFNVDIQRELPWGIFVDAAYAGSRGVHLPSPNNVSINNIPDSFYAQAEQQSLAGQPVTITTKIPNPFTGITTVSPLNPTANPTIFAGQLDRPYPQYSGLSLVGDGCCGSNYNSFQLTVNKRFKDGGTFLAAYTNAKLLSNTDTLTTWLETGVGEPQDWNNLKGERSISSQDVSQRLVISYVYDLPFGHGKRYMSDASGIVGKVVSGWGVDGVTTFQKGFPLPITYGASTALSSAGFSQNFQLRPNVVPGCNKGTTHTPSSAGFAWFNVDCFAPPGGTLAASAWAFGDESRVDPTLRGAGINNWDFALFKTTNFGPENRLGIQFRTEFFNTFNRVQFAPPNTACCNNAALGAINNTSFGIVSGQLNNPRLIQFALKFLF